MRILMVHNAYAKPSGEEHAARAIGDLLSSRGHEVRWMLRSSAEVADSLPGKAKSFFSGIYNPSARRAMTETLNREPVDLVQVQNLYPLLSPSILEPCRRRGIPVVMRCPNYRLFCPNGLHLSQGVICEKCLEPGREWWCLLRNCEKSLFKSAGYAARNAAARITGMIRDNVTLFVVLSEFQRQRFIAGGIEADRIAVIPNFDASAENVGESQKDALGETVSFAGRISPEKGLEAFLEAAKAMPKAAFAVAGSTARMPEIQKKASPNIRFHGFLANGAYDDFFLKTRVLVLPGLCFEGFPNVITRAMAFGKPVVAARIGAIPEIVEDGKTGLLYEPGNGAQMLERIQRLYDDPALCCAMGEAGREKARREYSPDAVYTKWISAYEKATGLSQRN